MSQPLPQVERTPLTEERMIWCKSLKEVELRSLASDYLMGRIDETTSDAFIEFELRFGPYVKGDNTPSKSKKAQKRSRK